MGAGTEACANAICSGPHDPPGFFFGGGSLTSSAFLPRPKREGFFKADNHSGMRHIDECSRGRSKPKTHVTPLPSDGVTSCHGVCNTKSNGFRPSLSRSHLDPQTARPAMSNSRQSRPLPFMEASEGFVFLVFPESASGVPCGLVGGDVREWAELIGRKHERRANQRLDCGAGNMSSAVRADPDQQSRTAG